MKSLKLSSQGNAQYQIGIARLWDFSLVPRFQANSLRQDCALLDNLHLNMRESEFHLKKKNKTRQNTTVFEKYSSHIKTIFSNLISPLHRLIPFHRHCPPFWFCSCMRKK